MIKERDTICWNCKHCTGATSPNPLYKQEPTAPKFFTCPWATEGKPVPGWTAEKTDLKVSPEVTTESYLVEACPYFEPDLGAKIAAMSNEEIAKRLEVSTRFVSKHLKLTRQVLYTYVKRYNSKVHEYKERTGEKILPMEMRYEMKTGIVQDILETAEDEIREYEEELVAGTGDSSSDDVKYVRSLKQMIPDCKEMLTQMKNSYKRRVKAAAAAGQDKDQDKDQDKSEE